MGPLLASGLLINWDTPEWPWCGGITMSTAIQKPPGAGEGRAQDGDAGNVNLMRGKAMKDSMKLMIIPSNSMLCDGHPKITIEVYGSNMGNLDHIMSCLVRPALMAFGFNQKTVDDYFGEP